MEKLHRQNLIIVWCSIIALSLVSLMGYGFTVLAIRGIAILVVAGIISTIGCYLSIDDVKKVLIIVFPLLSLPQGSSARKSVSRTRLVFLPGSGAAFSFSQTRP